MREHLFRECPIVKKTWDKLGVTWPITEENTDFKEWFKNIFVKISGQVQDDSMCFVGNLDIKKQIHS